MTSVQITDWCVFLDHTPDFLSSWDIWSQTWWMWYVYVPEFLNIAKMDPGLQKQGQAGYENLIGIKVLNVSYCLEVLFCVHISTLKFTGPIPC